MLAPALDAVPGLPHGRGCPRKRPDKLHADKAYDNRSCRTQYRARSITPPHRAAWSGQQRKAGPAPLGR